MLFYSWVCFYRCWMGFNWCCQKWRITDYDMAKVWIKKCDFYHENFNTVIIYIKLALSIGAGW